MAYLKKFNEVYAKLIAETVDNEMTVELEVTKRSDGHKQLKEDAKKVGIEIEIVEGFNDITERAVLTGSKKALQKFVKKNFIGGVEPKVFAKDNDPDNEGGLWSLFDLEEANDDLEFSINIGLASNPADDEWMKSLGAKPQKDIYDIDMNKGKIWSLTVSENGLLDFISHKLESTGSSICEQITSGMRTPKDFDDRLPYEIFKDLEQFKSIDFAKYFTIDASLFKL